MKHTKGRTPLHSRQFTLVALGPPRSQEQIQQEIDAARREALQDYVDEITQTQPLHGFLGGGLEWLWVFAVLPGAKAAGLGFAGALGKKAFDKLYELFENRLRKRNLLPKAGSTETSAAKRPHHRSSAGKTGKAKRRQSTRKS